mmetsp:Transcript_110151/g.351008  ORF Transcript_110151/g.351008 Transcript_110151/m.351008 type:complete len:242 (+) Transcript_110151:3797-4522(+)
MPQGCGRSGGVAGCLKGRRRRALLGMFRLQRPHPFDEVAAGLQVSQCDPAARCRDAPTQPLLPWAMVHLQNLYEVVGNDHALDVSRRDGVSNCSHAQHTILTWGKASILTRIFAASSFSELAIGTSPTAVLYRARPATAKGQARKRPRVCKKHCTTFSLWKAPGGSSDLWRLLRLFVGLHPDVPRARRRGRLVPPPGVGLVPAAQKGDLSLQQVASSLLQCHTSGHGLDLHLQPADPAKGW